MDESQTIVEVIQAQPESLYGIEKAAIDVQVATARNYPRNTKRCIDEAVTSVTISVDVAQQMGYALPRGGKPITGPSVHLARVMAQSWGNLRAGTRMVSVDEKSVTSEAICWDMEKNVAVSVTARRGIMTKEGKRYGDDMINMTANACNSVALRNAIFAVIPRVMWEHVYSESQKMITGDLSDETKFKAERLNILKRMSESLAVSEEEILRSIGRPSVQMVVREDLAILIGLGQAIKDGDFTVQDVFKSAQPSGARPRSEQIARKKEAERYANRLALMTSEELDSELEKFVDSNEKTSHLEQALYDEINRREINESE